MKLYLSSFRVGDRSAELAEMCSGRRIGLIPNAMDDVAPEPRAVSNDKAIKELVDLGIDVEVLDLRDYFGDQARLEAILLPHYESDHWESATIDKEVEFCTRKGIPFRTLRDGEVLVLELPRDSA